MKSHEKDRKFQKWEWVFERELEVRMFNYLS
jgi:hypothetical protein